MSAQITAWSFSRWKDYEQCPRRAKYKHVDKIKEPPNKAMQRGTDIHKMAEDFLNGKLKVLPKELLTFAKDFKALKKIKAEPEVEIALNDNWEPVAWFDKEAWLRLKVDIRVIDAPVLILIDNKTGKEKEDHILQLDLYALIGLMLMPEIEKVIAKLWYLDLGTETSGEFQRSELPVLKERWLKRIKPMMKDTRFAPKPGYYCQWCAFSKAKGGECEF